MARRFIYDISSNSGGELLDVNYASGMEVDIYHTSSQNTVGSTSTINDNEYFWVDETPDDSSDADVEYQNAFSQGGYEEVGLKAIQYTDALSNAVYISVPASYYISYGIVRDDDGDLKCMFYFHTDEAAAWFADTMQGIPSDATNISTDVNGYGSSIDATTDSGVPCFCAGSLIETEFGERAVETLEVGDLILTEDRGLQPVRWIGSQKFDADALAANPKLIPVKITAASMGKGLPKRDLYVSRQHRMVVSSKIAKRMFGADSALIPAIKLTAMPGIFIDEDTKQVEYFHILLDNHEIVFVEGAPAETLHTGVEVFKSLPNEGREEIFAIFPELKDPSFSRKLARPSLDRAAKGKRMIERHIKNNIQLLM